MNLNFTPEMIVALTAAFFSVMGIISAMVSRKQYRKCRGLLELTEAQLSEQDAAVKALNTSMGEFKQRSADQSRRIAWLESRVRQPKLLREDAAKTAKAASETAAETPAEEPAKWTMTERRHRVLRLSSKGQTVKAISATLGMMPGEVELIINLNRANYSAFAQG